MPSQVAPARLRLDVAYDGTSFSGWAEQPGRRTVAGELRATLEQIFSGPPEQGPQGLTVAGRTDAGVHATGQVCHVEVSAGRWSSLQGTLLRRLAGLLPLDIRVTGVAEVPVDFDARFSALWRRYEYRVTDDPIGASPLHRRYTLAWPRPLQVDALGLAAAGLLGEHDFAAFCKRKENATTIRRLTHLQWRRDEAGVLVATVQADAFCQAMVRSLVGAMLIAGDGRRPPDWPAGLLTRTDRASEVPVVGPHGLCLVAVGYPQDPAGYSARAQQARRRRTREVC